MTNYAYAPNATLQTISSARVIEGLIERDHSISVRLQGMLITDMNGYDTYPQQIVRTGLQDKYTHLVLTVQDGIQGNGHWQTTETYGDVPLVNAQQTARRDLGPYYQSYIHSFFEAGTKWYSAADNFSNDYQNINGFVQAGVGGGVDYIITDTLGDMTRVTSGANWTNFMTAWHGLYASAQTALEDAWIAVRDATTTVQVRNIMNALPAIPTDPNDPGP